MPIIPDFSDLMPRWSTAVAHWKSPELTALNNALLDYQADQTPPNLERLAARLDTWVRKKTDASGTFHTHRDPALMAALRQRVANAFLPVPPRTWDPRYLGILIAHDLYRGKTWVPNNFVGLVRTALNTIESAPVGQGLLRDISHACQSRGLKVVIEHIAHGSTAVPIDDLSPAGRQRIQSLMAEGGLLGSPAQEEMARLNSQPAILMQPAGGGYVRGGGTSAVVCWAPDAVVPNDPRSPFIGLAHELVHAYHFVMGGCFAAYTGGIMNPNGGMAQEEMRTVGIGPYADETPSENAIRAEHLGEGHRDNYNQQAAQFWAGAQPKLAQHPRTPAELKAIPRPPAGPKPPALAGHH